MKSREERPCSEEDAVDFEESVRRAMKHLEDPLLMFSHDEFNGFHVFHVPRG